MEKWNVKKFQKMYSSDKRNALKLVFTHNKTLIKDKHVTIPLTIGLTAEQFKNDLQETKLTRYKKSKIMFMKEPTDRTSYILMDLGFNVVSLNFCDPIDAGGLYTIGYDTQEEELCRTIPALYNSLKESQMYPFDGYEKILYTANITLFRDSKNNYNRYKTPKNISVISASAPNLSTTKFDKQKVYNIMEMIYFSPKVYDSKKNAIILGAWGCGAFGNDPKTIAKLFHRLIYKHMNLYKLICFSITSDEHYQVFREIFKNKTEKCDEDKKN